ncbi:hypothetical protein EDD37DRAFT_683827 [Exophiala viscosa]|uniref:uncharacterized protein n=1 Tax=Exophiala viscosa TaxID=2486360 RepID=UPI0021A067D4|nr:hypothetical protein EDD37DRAFT_683827 [Exophiala viscosa]
MLNSSFPTVWTTEPITVLTNYTQDYHFEAKSLITTWVFFTQLITFNNFWKLSTLVLLLINIKVFPFVYHLRILNGLRFVLRSQRPKRDVGPENLFQPIITSSKAPLMEIDVFGHKSNSTYFCDIDIARVHLITTLFGNGIANIRGDTTMNGLRGKPSSKFSVALGAVSCVFRKEILPYETYDMWTKVLAWDDKWFYLVTHFVKKGHKIEPRRSSLYPQQNKNRSAQDQSEDQEDTAIFNTETTDSTAGPATAPIAASALSKVVYKNGRITIRPKEMLEKAGLMPVIQSGDDKDEAAGEDPEKIKLATAIEAERQRGMRIAALLSEQSALEGEFNSDTALGRHYDGIGVEGVVATLAQLGKVSPYQLV